MADRIISLDVRELDGVLTELEGELSAQGVPTAQRLRAATLTEELFAALRALDRVSGMLRCTFPTPRTVELQYRDSKGPLAPDTAMVERLARNPCMEGVRIAFREGGCTIAVKG